MRLIGLMARIVAAISARTANGNGTGVDFSRVSGEVAFTLISGAGGVGETMDVVLQESDTLNGTYDDIPGGAFAQVGNAAAQETLVLFLPHRKAFIRAAWTVSGGSFTSAVVANQHPLMV